ncbi:MAG: carboxypeptidase regulatory-like domain-containing protein [Gemmatimonadaceae bacterium]|nr:carboxypeptidase regulatory-like domain-containing protein [Gemmatimonadaceae bacterium]MCC6431232.1 carboxypeptidase regulatory-like domain-containing protein [Gemmatimonadaceae bacterium]
MPRHLLVPLLLFWLTSLSAVRSAVRSVDGPQTRGATVRGSVFDSLAHAPLPDALVQLVGDDLGAPYGHTVQSDSLGTFEFTDVPAGRYLLGFIHPMLDSLGIEPLVRAVTVAAESTIHADLAIPAPGRLRAAICGPPSPQNGGALVFGVVRDARTRAALANATVKAEWLELAFARRRVVAFTPRKQFTTKDGGWFAFCNAPSPGTMKLSAHRGGDSTDVIEVAVPGDGVLRRELFLGSTLAEAPRATETGVRLSGIVLAGRDGSPLADAQVSIIGGPEARANERGQWAIVSAPVGTRTLEVRAVGHYPVRRAVDVMDGVAPIRVSLVTLKSVLDTMKTVSKRRVNTNLMGFHERRQMGNGQFFGPEDVERLRPLQTSDLFRQVRGLMLDRGQASDLSSPFEGRAATTRAAPAPENKFVMRGLFAPNCIPTVFLNDHRLNDINAEDLDGFVRPREIAGIEIYSPTQAPAQFQPGLSGCGAIVIWTR